MAKHPKDGKPAKRDRPAKRNKPATNALPGTRAELLELHDAARRRRNDAKLGSAAWTAASMDVVRIEVEIARVERAMDPPLI